MHLLILWNLITGTYGEKVAMPWYTNKAIATASQINRCYNVPRFLLCQIPAAQDAGQVAGETPSSCWWRSAEESERLAVCSASTCHHSERNQKTAKKVNMHCAYFTLGKRHGLPVHELQYDCTKVSTTTARPDVHLNKIHYIGSSWIFVVSEEAKR